MSLDQLLLGLTCKTVLKISDTPQHTHSHLRKKMVFRPCLSHLSHEGQIQWLKPVFLALERLLDRIVIAYLVYIMTSRPASSTKWNPVSNWSLKSPLRDCSDHMTSCLPGIIGSSYCIQKTCSAWALCVSCTRHQRMQCRFSTHRTSLCREHSNNSGQNNIRSCSGRAGRKDWRREGPAFLMQETEPNASLQPPHFIQASW